MRQPAQIRPHGATRWFVGDDDHGRRGSKTMQRVASQAFSVLSANSWGCLCVGFQQNGVMMTREHGRGTVLI